MAKRRHTFEDDDAQDDSGARPAPASSTTPPAAPGLRPPSQTSLPQPPAIPTARGIRPASQPALPPRIRGPNDALAATMAATAATPTAEVTHPFIGTEKKIIENNSRERLLTLHPDGRIENFKNQQIAALRPDGMMEDHRCRPIGRIEGNVVRDAALHLLATYYPETGRVEDRVRHDLGYVTKGVIEQPSHARLGSYLPAGGELAIVAVLVLVHREWFVADD